MRNLLRVGALFAPVLLAGSIAAFAQGTPEPTPTPPPPPVPEETQESKPPEDGPLDASKRRLLPVILPITEPAVGYGAIAGVVFIEPQPPTQTAGPAKPRLTAVGGMATENETWALFGVHTRTWKEGKIETLFGAGYGSINLDYFGASEDSPLASNPIRYNLEPAGGVVNAKWRLGKSAAHVGLGYSYATTKVSFADGDLPPEISEKELDSTVAGLKPDLTYDSRNNTFTPTSGTYAKASVGIYADWLGGDFDYQMVNVEGIFHWPFSSKLFGGVKVDGQFAFGELPFYSKPFVDLRGAEIRRYVGENVAQAELEARWQALGRWSLVGFVGTGFAWNEGDFGDQERDIVTGGGGVRYELFQSLGLHVGLDVGVGPDVTAIYVILGNAWFRP